MKENGITNPVGLLKEDTYSANAYACALESCEKGNIKWHYCSEGDYPENYDTLIDEDFQISAHSQTRNATKAVIVHVNNGIEEDGYYCIDWRWNPGGEIKWTSQPVLHIDRWTEIPDEILYDREKRYPYEMDIKYFEKKKRAEESEKIEEKEANKNSWSFNEFAKKIINLGANDWHYCFLEENYPENYKSLLRGNTSVVSMYKMTTKPVVIHVYQELIKDGERGVADFYDIDWRWNPEGKMKWTSQTDESVRRWMEIPEDILRDWENGLPYQEMDEKYFSSKDSKCKEADSKVKNCSNCFHDMNDSCCEQCNVIDGKEPLYWEEKGDTDILTSWGKHYYKNKGDEFTRPFFKDLFERENKIFDKYKKDYQDFYNKWIEENSEKYGEKRLTKLTVSYGLKAVSLINMWIDKYGEDYYDNEEWKEEIESFTYGGIKANMYMGYKYF